MSNPFKQSFLIFALFFSSSLCSATDLSAFPPIYKQLLLDLASDIVEYDDFSMGIRERKETAEKWKLYVNGASTENPLQNSAWTFEGIWPPHDLPSSTVPVNDHDYQRLLIPKFDSTTSYSISNIYAYADARLGPSLAAAVRQHKVEIEVVGESSYRFGSRAKKQGRKYLRIPSPYEKWDIEKFLDVTPGQMRPCVVIRLSPYQQLVKHYAELIESLGGVLKNVTLNRTDRVSYRNDFRKSVSALFGTLTKKPNYVAIGYQSHWKEALSDPASPWFLLSSQDLPKQNALTGVLLEIQARKQPGLVRNLLALSSERTLWGEGMRFLVEGILEEMPQAVFVLGSAGNISNSRRLNVYDVSVPKLFHTDSGKVVGQNLAFSMTHPEKGDWRISGNGVNVRYGSSHGNTSSPVEETRDALLQLRKKGIDTVDVEHSLAAEAVASFNRTKGSKVQFAAIHVITDDPGQVISPKESHFKKTEGSITNDLTLIDFEKKRAAKEAAVRVALDTIARHNSCSHFYGSWIEESKKW